MTALDLITRSLRLIGAIGAVDTPDDDDADTCFDALNDFIDALGTHRQSMYYIKRTAYSLSDGVASYSIGSGGTFNQARPVNQDFTASVISGGTWPEMPIGRPLSIDAYQHISDKTVTSAFPTRIYYDHNWSAGLGLIYVYPVPDNDDAGLILYTPTPVSTFADLSTDYTFPPGYKRMLRYNLAVEVAPEFDKPVSSEVARIARESLADIKRANFRPSEAKLPVSLVGRTGRYNIEADE